MKALGIDVGSLTTKVVILNGNAIVSSSIVDSDDEAEASAMEAIAQALGQTEFSIDGNYYVVSTGARGLQDKRAW
jgi:activator of 2-hydroxyglutaryl-CoA dehydratase